MDSKEINKRRLGRNIYHERKKYGITTNELGMLCDVHGSFIRQIECGTKTPSLPLFIRICNQIHTTPDKLLCGLFYPIESPETKEKMLAQFKTKSSDVQSQLLKIANILEDKPIGERQP